MPKGKDKTTASAAPAKPKKVSKKATKVEEPVVETAPEVTEPEVTAPVEETTDVVNGDFVNFMAKLQQVGTLISGLKQDFRALEKKATRELRNAQKANQKRKRKAGNRAPSGFVKPTLISNELANFLGKEQGTEMARTEVTREINAYIRTHSLQDPQNGRKINADKKLSTLLKLKSSDELTYFNLQKFMSPHFAKAGQPIENQ